MPSLFIMIVLTRCSKQFITVHQELLSILTGKAGLFSDIPFIGAPVAQALRQIEDVVDVSTYLAHRFDFYMLLPRSRH
jgi:hypothetical protein